MSKTKEERKSSLSFPRPEFSDKWYLFDTALENSHLRGWSVVATWLIIIIMKNLITEA